MQDSERDSHIENLLSAAAPCLQIPRRLIEQASDELDSLRAELEAERAKRKAVPANTEPATEDAPAYVTLSEHSAEWALNTLVALSEENDAARKVVGPIVSDLRIALCRPWKPAKREAVANGYRLQPLSEYEAMRAALDLPEGNFPKWKEALIADMQSSYNTDGITLEDSGDPLIYLQSAIAIIEDFELPLAASQPKEAP